MLCECFFHESEFKCRSFMVELWAVWSYCPCLSERSCEKRRSIYFSSSSRSHTQYLDSASYSLLQVWSSESSGQVCPYQITSPAPFHSSCLHRDCLAAGPSIGDVPTGPAAMNKNKTCYRCQNEGHVLSLPSHLYSALIPISS